MVDSFDQAIKVCKPTNKMNILSPALNIKIKLKVNRIFFKIIFVQVCLPGLVYCKGPTAIGYSTIKQENWYANFNEMIN